MEPGSEPEDGCGEAAEMALGGVLDSSSGCGMPAAAAAAADISSSGVLSAGDGASSGRLPASLLEAFEEGDAGLAGDSGGLGGPIVRGKRGGVLGAFEN